MLNTDTKLLISDYNKVGLQNICLYSIRLLQFLNKKISKNVNKYI